MRIISGQYKGRNLIGPLDKNTRPLKDLTKELIFNILHHSKKISLTFKDTKVLDLFSGVGSFGIECLSRGAGYVTFIDNHPQALKILKKNLLNFKIEKSFEILEKNILKDLSFNEVKLNFDIIFIDPPFKEKNLLKIISNIDQENFLNPDGIIIVHRNKKYKDMFPVNFRIIEEKIYGISKIIFGNFI